MRRNYIVFLIIITVFVACALTAPLRLYQESVPSIPFEEIGSTNISSLINGTVHVNGLEVVLERTSLVDLQQKRGGFIQHQGDAGESLYFLCYNSKYNNIPIQAWFFSGELGGENHLIHGVYVRKGYSFMNLISKCVDIKEGSVSLKIDGGFWIDKDMDVVNKKTRNQQSSKDGWKFYSYIEDGDNELQKMNVLGVEIHKHRIESLYLGQITTY